MSHPKLDNSLTSILGWICLILLLAACTEQVSQSEAKDSDQITADSIAQIQQREAELLAGLQEKMQNAPMVYVVSSQHTIRREPNLNSSEVALVSLGEALRFGGELGGDSTGVMINDEVKVARFARVMTKEGQVGWIHQGAIKSNMQEEIQESSTQQVAGVLTFSKVDFSQDIQPDGWRAIYESFGGCQDPGCPRFYGNTSSKHFIVELCDPLDTYQAGVHIFYPSGENQHINWWDEEYGSETCHRSGIIYYTAEKMNANTNKIQELRMQYEFEDKYGNYLLELGEDPTPFVLEEKTGTQSS